MKLKRMKFIFLIIILLGNVSAKIKGINQDELLTTIVNSKPVLNFSHKEIPKNILKRYKEKYHTQLILSDPGSPYNTTDVIYKNEPFGMLLFSGLDKNNYGFILFEVKGVSSQCHFVFYKLKRKKVIEMEALILNKQPKDFKDLQAILQSKNYIK